MDLAANRRLDRLARPFAPALTCLLLAGVASAADTGGVGREEALGRRWADLWTRLEARGAAGDPDAVFHRLTARYREPHRAYHDLTHIEHVLAEFDAARDLAEDPEAVEWALWFHDAVYDLGSRDNETDSARLAREAALELGLGEAWAERVAGLVLATHHGEVPQAPDARLVVDVDLSILGQPWERFDDYEARVRAEYEPVIRERGAAAFDAGRARILRRFLERPAIYSTELFRRKYEAAARANLERSIERLEAASWTDPEPRGQNRLHP